MPQRSHLELTVNSPFDDGICLKSLCARVAHATENVTITNCQVSGYEKALCSTATYKSAAGSGNTGGSSSDRIQRRIQEHHDFKLRVRLLPRSGDRERRWRRDRGCRVTNLTMRDISGAPIFVRLWNWARGPNTPAVGTINRIRINNVVASGVSSGQGILVAGIPGHPIEDLTMSDIRIVVRGWWHRR